MFSMWYLNSFLHIGIPFCLSHLILVFCLRGSLMEWSRRSTFCLLSSYSLSIINYTYLLSLVKSTLIFIIYFRISLCTVCALLVCCILFTILTVMLLGIGIGYHYCSVQNSVENISKFTSIYSAKITPRTDSSAIVTYQTPVDCAFRFNHSNVLFFKLA